MTGAAIMGWAFFILLAAVLNYDVPGDIDAAFIVVLQLSFDDRKLGRLNDSRFPTMVYILLE